VDDGSKISTAAGSAVVGELTYLKNLLNFSLHSPGTIRYEKQHPNKVITEAITNPVAFLDSYIIQIPKIIGIIVNANIVYAHNK